MIRRRQYPAPARLWLTWAMLTLLLALPLSSPAMLIHQHGGADLHTHIARLVELTGGQADRWHHDEHADDPHHHDHDAGEHGREHPHPCKVVVAAEQFTSHAADVMFAAALTALPLPELFVSRPVIASPAPSAFLRVPVPPPDALTFVLRSNHALLV